MEQPINPKMVTLAREYRGLTQKDLSAKMNITQGFLSKIEKGILPGNDDVLKSLCNELNLPSEFFTRQGETFYPLLYYRKKASTSPKVVTRAEAEMNIHRLNVQELLKSVDLHAKAVPYMDIEEHGTPEKIAMKLRSHWGVPSGPINNLFDLVEGNGIFIIMCDFDSMDIVGRTMFTDNKQPIIFINRAVCVDRQRFTLAHELGHVIMHKGGFVPENRDTEKEANIFASEFLIPEKDLRKQIYGTLTVAQLSDLKRYWKIAMSAIRYKANYSKLITPQNHQSLIFQMNNMRTQEPVELEPPKETPKLFSHLIKLHLNDLEFSENELSAILAFNTDEFRTKYLNESKKMRAMWNFSN